MHQPIRWGILSTGGIARTFAEGLGHTKDAQLVAVGSRDQASADAFGDKYQVKNRHASYESLAHDPEVDVIYIGTPHPFHKDNMLLCLNAGKHVLCEKPFTLNRAEAQEAVDLAREKNLFLMEAAWTRFLPVMGKVRELIAEGMLGTVRTLSADFSFSKSFDPEHRAYNIELGGGGLLDVGVYAITLASMVYGRQPESFKSVVNIGATGVDYSSALLFDYGQGQFATITSGVTVAGSQTAHIMGDKASIRIPKPWWNSRKLFLDQAYSETMIELPFAGNGYNYEAEEVIRCIRAGEHESPLLPLSETLANLGTMDAIRAEWGLVYPSEA